MKKLGPGRIELPTSRLSGVRSNQLSYEPEGYWLLIIDNWLLIIFLCYDLTIFEVEAAKQINLSIINLQLSILLRSDSLTIYLRKSNKKNHCLTGSGFDILLRYRS